MTREEIDQHRGLFRPTNRAMAKPDMQVRKGYFGAEIPVIGIVTRKTIPSRRYGRGALSGYEAFWLDIRHAGASEDHRKEGFVQSGLPEFLGTLGGEIGKKRIERKKIRDLLGQEVIDALPRGFKVGDKIPFKAWAYLWATPGFAPTMTIEDTNISNTLPTNDFGGRMAAKQWWHTTKNVPGFLMVERGPAKGLTVEYTADELNKALQPGFRQMKQIKK